MKSKLGMFAMMAAMVSMGETGYSEKSEYRQLTDERKSGTKIYCGKEAIRAITMKQ